MMTIKRTHLLWLIPLLLMAVITPFTPWIDLTTARYFYAKGGGHFISNSFTYFMYNYGVIPADITGVLAAVAFVLSYIFKKWKPWRAPALLLLLTMAIGAGLITHLILKDHWGRPRPKQVIEFGGHQQFRPYYDPNFFHKPEPSKSFPCGHCSMGFFFFALALAGRRIGSSFTYYAGMLLAIVLGILLGITRIAQGGHFVSDVLFSALIMWLTALACDWLIKRAQESSS